MTAAKRTLSHRSRYDLAHSCGVSSQVWIVPIEGSSIECEIVCNGANNGTLPVVCHNLTIQMTVHEVVSRFRGV